MIKNWEYHSLRMDYSSMYKGNHHPSDIDMFYIGRDKFLIIGEIKNERGELKDGQRHILETLLNGWKADGVILYITHDKYAQNGDTTVDVPECYVNEIYYKVLGEWTKPKRPTKVKEVIEYYGKVNHEQ